MRRRYALRDDQWDVIKGFLPGREETVRFSRWAQSGVLEAVFAHFASDAGNEYAMIDSTIVRAHQHSARAVKRKTRTRQSGEAKAG
jgi:transposase